MNKAQKDLLLELSRNERRRLFLVKNRSWECYSESQKNEINGEIELLTLTINQLKGGK